MASGKHALVTQAKSCSQNSNKGSVTPRTQRWGTAIVDGLNLFSETLIQMFARPLRGLVRFLRSHFSQPFLRAVACLLIIGAAPCYAICWRHFCMCGHMAHPPYQLIEHLNDHLWIWGFLTSMLLVLLSDLSWKFAFCGAVGFLLWAKVEGLGLFDAAEWVLPALTVASLVGLFTSCRPPVRGAGCRPFVLEAFCSLLVAVAAFVGYHVLSVEAPPQWKTVRKGMAMQQVHQILGQPAGHTKSTKRTPPIERYPTQVASQLAVQTKSTKRIPMPKTSWWEWWKVQGVVNQVICNISVNASNQIDHVSIRSSPKGLCYYLGIDDD
jgi:hypothetical protein